MKQYFIKKLILFLILSSSLLHASMGALLIIPRDANVVMGIYSGAIKTSTTLGIESTNSAIDTQSFKHENVAAFLGTMIGLQNDYYRFNLTYDINSDSDLELQRILMNFDFMIGERESFRPMLGVGVGVAKCSYDINNKNIKQESGLLVFRAGTEYAIDNSNSIEMMLEYSHVITNSVGRNFYEGDDFTTYNIEEKNDIILRIGYNFTFQF